MCSQKTNCSSERNNMITFEIYILTVIILVSLIAWQHKRIDDLRNLTNDALEYSVSALKENAEFYAKMKDMIDNMRNLPNYLENIQEYINTLNKDIENIYKNIDIKRGEV